MKIDKTLQDLQSRLNYVNQVVDYAEKQLKKSPPGRLRIQRQGQSLTYYCAGEIKGDKDHNGRRLDASDKQIISDLAQKSYLRKVRQSALEEQRAIRKILDNYPKLQFENIYKDLRDDRKTLIRPVALSDEEYERQWLGKPYDKKGFSEGDPNFVTLKGERVRSKSEQIIADRLTYHNIPYKYECPIRLDIGVFHPDFTVLRLRDRKEIYWEHCGAMDKQSYADYAVNRFNVYARNNIILGKDLVATFETGMFPLDTEILDKFILAHFK